MEEPRLYTSIFHVMGEGWYVETSLGVKGPFTVREAAECYVDALTVAFEGVGEITPDQLEIVEKSLVVESAYVGLDRRIGERRTVHDRRSRIRYETLRNPRRSDRERRDSV
ncbi:MAG: hypothetical protein Kow006_00040 [Gammaproteobacteria bacterium]